MLKRSPLQAVFEQARAHYEESDGQLRVARFGNPEEEAARARRGVVCADLSFTAKALREGPTRSKLAIGSGKSNNKGKGRLFRLRKDQIFEWGSVTKSKGVRFDMTDTWAALQLIGPQTQTLLSRLCGLDFDDFPDQSVRQSSVAKTKQLILRWDMGGTRAYTLVGARSLAEYLYRTAEEAAAGLEWAPIGSQALTLLEPKSG